MTPREFFPKMPDAVYNMWLAPLVNEIGWPFSDHNTEFGDSRWKYLFGRIPISDWRSKDWHLIDLDWNNTPIDSMTVWLLDDIKKNCVAGSATMTAKVENTQMSFRTSVEFIHANRRLPKAVVAFFRSGRLEIVDGTHRMAALLYVGIPEGYKVPTWIPKENA